ncbi:MAG TPA: carotenoid oxygenase family protein, partial [Acidimicrobiales bacterium]|nr:carotenoid oxygenase family protein [Acidimicrobiales bacterium]
MAVIEGEDRKYLTGNYGPVAEEVTALDLDVTGALPPELTGQYVRIGPNPWPIPEGPYHWFTGAGMVHGVRLEGGTAQWYRNRWVRTAAEADRLGEAQRPGPVPPMYDSSNTNVMAHAGRILAMTEGSMPYVLDGELNTIERTDFGGVPSYTAHPKVDGVTGELLGFRYWFDEPYAEYFAVDATGALTRSVPIDTTGPVMMHDFSVSEKYAVFYDLPVTFRIDLAMDPTVPFPFAWDDEYPARIGVLPRDPAQGDNVRWFDIDPCYVFHPMNAYDDGDEIVLDVVHHPEVFRRIERPSGMALINTTSLQRWTIDLAAGKVRQETIDDRPVEFPQVDPRRAAHRHRIGYSMASSDDSGDAGGGIVKHDMVSGASSTFDVGAGRSNGEASF